jgi:hypothetical protein
VLEVETLLRVLFADQGSVEDLRSALKVTASQAREAGSASVILGDELLNTGGPFPDRLHLTERVVAFYGEFLLLLIRWCDETMDEVDTWSTTKDLGLTPQARQRLSELLAEARSLLSG